MLNSPKSPLVEKRAVYEGRNLHRDDLRVLQHNHGVKGPATKTTMGDR
jgi:hypothetical protein